MLFSESEDTDVIKYAGDLLQPIEIFLIWDQHPKKVFEDSAWRGETTAMKVVVPILPKQGAEHRPYPVSWAQAIRRSHRTSGKSKKHSNMVVGLWSSFSWPIQFSFYSSLFLHSSHSFHCTHHYSAHFLILNCTCISFLNFYFLLIRSISLALPLHLVA